MLHYKITVPPGGQTVLYPSVTECYFLLSPYILFFCDNLEMSSKSNIFIFCVCGCMMYLLERLKQNQRNVYHQAQRRKKERTYRCCILAIQPVCTAMTEQYKSYCCVYKRVFLLLFCCNEERMY